MSSVTVDSAAESSSAALVTAVFGANEVTK